MINGLKRISKPSRRTYAKAGKMPRVLGGMGMAVVSTSKGILTGKEAMQRRLGGEVLCSVW